MYARSMDLRTYRRRTRGVGFSGTEDVGSDVGSGLGFWHSFTPFCLMPIDFPPGFVS
jgi:hypothetical protein